MNKEMTKEIAVVYDCNGCEVKLTQSIVQDFIVGSNNGKITLPEFKFFTELCKARKLNPFLKEAYCIKYGDQPATIVVSKDVFLKRAISNPDYNGMEDGIIVIDENDEVVERKGCFYLPTDTIVGAWAKVYRKSWAYPTYCSVSFEEVAQRKKGGELNSNWASKAATMVNKVAKVRALRETFIEEFAGMYVEDEMPLQEQTTNEVYTETKPKEKPVEKPIEQADVFEMPQDDEVLSLADL